MGMVTKELTRQDLIKKYSQTDIARALGLNVSNVHRILHGQRTPHLRTFKRLADYLKISLDELYRVLEIDG